MEQNKFAAPLSALLTELYEEAAVDQLDMNDDMNRYQMISRYIGRFRDLAQSINKEKQFYSMVLQSLPEFMANKIMIHEHKSMRVTSVFKHLVIKWCFSSNEAKLNIIAVYCVPVLVELYDQEAS